MNQRTSLSVSVRRHFVDNFFIDNKNLYINKKIIDVGGKKEHKRGLFRIEDFSKNVTYVNIDASTDPDIIADATNIPVPDSSYDIVLMGELLEHVISPIDVMKEAYRILTPGGSLIATVPFMFPVHADPYDFGRYTETFWKKASNTCGFKRIEVASQGTFFAVSALMVQHYFSSPASSPIGKFIKKIFRIIFKEVLIKLFMWLDTRTRAPLLTAWKTGYGLVFTK